MFFLNDLQIYNLIEYRIQYGKLLSIYELQVIDGFNEEVVNQMLSYITLSPLNAEKFSLKNALLYGKTDIMLRYQRVIQKQKGYLSGSDSLRKANPNNYYLGDPNSLLVKAEYSYKDNLRFGFIGEKDAGEPFIPKSDTLRKGFDYSSFHLFVKDIGIVKQLVIGDYHVQFGQGLTLWSGFSMGKVPGALMLRKRASALRPHVSANEVFFQRGIATTLSFGRFDLTSFYSNRKVDANIVVADTLLTSEEMVSSLQETGYHRTPAELTDKGSNREIAEGGHIAYNGLHVKAGCTLFHEQYLKPFTVQNELYKKFQPSLTNNMYAGFDYCTNYRTLTLYGEFSKWWNSCFAGHFLYPEY